MTAEVMLRVEDVTRRYGSLVAVDHLSFEVRRGEMFGLIGPDGAGKTTTLRMALGLIPPSEGRLTTCGLPPRGERRKLSGLVGYLSQRFSLYGDLSVDENIAFFAEIHGVTGWQARRDELLEMVRMAPFRARLAERLSGGMKQKLALACTLIHTPELLVLDEPTTGVDPVSRRDFWRLLARLQRDGLTILLTTPYLDEAERCARVALIDQGTLLVVDTPDALRTGTGLPMLEVIARPAREVAQWLRGRPEIAEVEPFGERLHASLRAGGAGDLAGTARRLAAELSAAGFQVEAARPTIPSLEDVFIERLRVRETAPQAAGGVA
jgi:ABC-2 type transport system ATP-binding protein